NCLGNRMHPTPPASPNPVMLVIPGFLSARFVICRHSFALARRALELSRWAGPTAHLVGLGDDGHLARLLRARCERPCRRAADERERTVACIATKSGASFPLWVRSDRGSRGRTSTHFRFCPQSGSQFTASLRVAKCQDRTHAPQRTIRAHLIGHPSYRSSWS